jgi:hypothetical protein
MRGRPQDLDHQIRADIPASEDRNLYAHE